MSYDEATRFPALDRNCVRGISPGCLLLSPATTFTVTMGSLADLVVLNATSVMVTLSGGESFSLLSPSYDLSIATSTGGGTVSNICAGGITTASLSQISGSTIYTIAPGGTLCSGASAPILSGISASGITSSGAVISWTTNITSDSTVSYGAGISYGATSTDPTLITSHTITLSGLSPSTTYHFAVTSSENGTSTTSGDNTFTTSVASGGGGSGGPSSSFGVSVGVAGSYGSPYVSGIGITASSSTSSGSSGPSVSTSSLLAELLSLETELAALEAQANRTASSTTHFTFTRNLSLGIIGNDVTELQQFFISANDGPAARKLAAHGTTEYFGTLTQNALIEFQKAAGISPSSGFFGPITRGYVNGL